MSWQNNTVAEDDESIETVKFRGTHLRTFYPKGSDGAKLGQLANNWGLVCWRIREELDGELDEDLTNGRTVTVCGQYEIGVDPDKEYVLVVKRTVDKRYGPQYALVCYNENYDFSNVNNQRAFLCTFLTENQIEGLYQLTDNPLKMIANHDVEGLKKVKGIGDYIANRIITSFENTKDLSQVYIELDGAGLTTNMIGKLVERYHTPAKIVDIVHNNPYQLIRDIDGVGFLTADKIALNSGTKETDTKRIKGYILWKLNSASEEGHSYLLARSLMEDLYCDLGGRETVVETYENPEDYEGESNNISLAIKQLVDEETIVVEDNESKGNRRVYLKRIWELEKEIAYHLKRLLTARNTFKIENVEEKIAQAEERQGFKFTQEQIDGIKLGLDKQVCLISGLAGSGKTSLVTGILSVLDNYTFAQCALSGKAAARLQEVTRQDGMTIHRLLGFGPMGFAYNESNPLPYHIIILDELSLVGGDIFVHLLRAIPTGSKLYMLGDIAQIESIGLLNLATDIFNSPEVPTVDLKQVHRQAKASGILTTAYDVRYQRQIFSENDFEGVEVFGEKQDMIIDTSPERENNRQKVVDYYEQYFNSDLVGGDVTKIQVISPVKERGDCCVFNLNLDIQALINPPENCRTIQVQRKKTASGTDRSFFIGENDKVMCIKNNYKVMTVDGGTTSMFNGWTGIVKEITDHFMVIDFDLAENLISLPIKDVGNYIVLGYASTCHKLQGSSADLVIGVVDYSTPPQMLNRQLVYTLLTRAKKKCIFVTQTMALRTAIATNSTSTKCTFLPELLEIPYDELRTWQLKRLREREEQRRARVKEILNSGVEETQGEGLLAPKMQKVDLPGTEYLFETEGEEERLDTCDTPLVFDGATDYKEKMFHDLFD